MIKFLTLWLEKKSLQYAVRHAKKNLTDKLTSLRAESQVLPLHKRIEEAVLEEKDFYAAETVKLQLCELERNLSDETVTQDTISLIKLAKIYVGLLQRLREKESRTIKPRTHTLVAYGGNPFGITTDECRDRLI